jgi:RNA polymerase sigma factor for flagellar operon FliA
LEDSTIGAESEQAGPFSQFEDAKFRQTLSEAIKTLPEREALMMSLYYGDELNLKEIGAVMGVSESRVSQIHGQALARLRGKIVEWVE